MEEGVAMDKGRDGRWARWTTAATDKRGDRRKGGTRWKVAVYDARPARGERMPTLPMYTQPAHPDASHGVRAPGGYEWWYFDAEDVEQDVQVVGILLDGFPFHPQYLRRHAKYLRAPTRNKPALPSEYPCAYLAVYEKGKLVTQVMSQYPAGSLESSATEPRVRVGPNALTPTGSGGLALRLEGAPWVLTGRGPRTFGEHKLTATMAFTPALSQSPVQRTFLSREMTGAEHHWILASPLNTFTATVEQTGPVARSWRLAGRAYHDHNFGTGPLGPGLKRWIWGRVLSESTCHTFHYALPRDSRLPAESHLIVSTPKGVEQIDARPAIDFSRRSPLGLAYPREIDFDGRLVLETPRLIDNTPFYLRLRYASLADGIRGTALCEVAYPRRLRWPILGRMIEMSIHAAGGKS